MQVVVPFAAESPKTRLEPVLSPDERSTLARAMLDDVLEAILETGHEPTVVSTAPLDAAASVLAADSVSVEIDDRSLTAAVDARLPAPGDDPVAVVMADLALATPTALKALFTSVADVAIAPGRGGGTNALVVSHPEFSVDYHGGSYLDHCAIAREVDATLETVDSFRLATDVDEPTDLVEILIHGEGRAPARLRSFGFELDTDAGRVAVSRR
ncbi:2-phospho-L-lactate guanylyltransferase [Salinadaptatus halalkaliphilus]|uniref:2-phospho-L-lactate guanylyltransferase n=1 Tax=Salinadaptatus halalkaliphilus TaxID=2419781 RepID=A0A4S3TTQ7_9EURY|nr:2-phospho-L-lactate guanylyltransferase [Salinadaptatus halalkaliphilus]THE66803.1 2-phospho-L-lactate guanylyltransferase [Salinadaptatus halalkaliphilus]